MLRDSCYFLLFGSTYLPARSLVANAAISSPRGVCADPNDAVEVDDRKEGFVLIVNILIARDVSKTCANIDAEQLV